ncbi:MAG: hypothetical protein CMJ28_07320 [Phycisphaerae bacterium]|nr:hypothetical protein [Phycisphaerae bacterium]
MRIIFGELELPNRDPSEIQLSNQGEPRTIRDRQEITSLLLRSPQIVMGRSRIRNRATSGFLEALSAGLGRPSPISGR